MALSDAHDDELGEDAADLLARIVNRVEARKPVVFLLGSALTMPSGPGVAGIPDVRGVVELLGEELGGRGGKSFDEAVAKAEAGDWDAWSKAYREGFRAVMQRGSGQDGANRVIRKAVLTAHELLDDAQREAIENGDRKACEALVAPPAKGWLPLRESMTALGQILQSDSKIFPRVLTTNFDPLIEVAVLRAKGHPHSTVLGRDGNPSQHLGSGTHVVYVHGHWYGADTLHTDAQLDKPRPQLEAALPHQIERALLVVLGYGGWDDVIMRSLVAVANDEEAKPDIVWGFYGEKDPKVVHKLEPAGQRFQPYEHVDMHELLPRLRDEVLRVLELDPSAPAPRRTQPAWLEAPYRELPTGLASIPGFRLLRSEYGVVRMSGRDAMLDDFTAWSEAPGLQIRLVTGPGGAGKTRLLRELCKQRIEQGWTAGLLRKSTDPAEPLSIVKAGRPLMLAIDYAETWSDALVALLDALAPHRNASARVRLVLAARAEAEWWKELPQKVDALWDLLHGTQIVHPLEQIDEVGTAWADAVQGFSRRRGDAAHEVTMPVNETLTRWMSEGVLTLHAAALLAVDGDPPPLDAGVQGLYDALLRREALKYWTPKAKELVGDSIANLDEVLRIVACIGTLAGPLKAREETRSVLQRTPGLGGQNEASLDALARVFRDLYPGPPGEHLDLPTVQPDRIGERLVGTQLERDPSIATVPFDTDESSLAEPALRVLGRAATWQPLLLNTIEAKIREFPRPLARSWVAVGTEEAWAADLAKPIERAFGDLDFLSPDEADELLGPLPLETVALRGIAMSLATRAASEIPAPEHRAAAPEAAREVFARKLSNLGIRFDAMGRREEALTATQEAIHSYQALAEQRPDAFTHNLAGELNNLGAMLNALGRSEEALTATRKAVDTYRTLAELRPDAFTPDLAMSLNNLGKMLSALGRREEALTATREAVDLRRALAELRPDAFTPDLAMSLNNLGAMLSALGRGEEALTATQEAVQTYRALAKQRPDAFTPHLAGALRNLGSRLNTLGRREEALTATQEAVDHHRALVEQRPDAFTPDLAMSFGVLGLVFMSAKRRAEGLDTFARGLRLLLPFYERFPTAFAGLVQVLAKYIFQAAQEADLAIPQDLRPLVESLSDAHSA